MNFLGMGSMEIIVVMLVAFIFLGPERMVEAARFLGKVVREARRMSADFRDIVLDEEELSRPPAGTTSPSGPGTRLGAAMGNSVPDSPPSESKEPSERASEEEDGPVAFRPAGGAQVQSEASVQSEATVQDEATPKGEQAQR